MEYKNLGDTAVEVPEVGLGASQYTAGAGPLREGISAGAFLVDTAESYGTEDQVGAAAVGMRSEIFIATKVSPAHFGHDELIAAAEASLKRLGTDYIDLYQLHQPNAEIPIAETMGAMDRLVEQGKVRHVGVSNFSVAQLAEAQSVSNNKIVSNQVKYHLADRAIEDGLLSYCQQNDVTIIAYSPLGAGMGKLKAKLRHGILEEVAKATGKTEAQVALNWCISKKNVIAIPKSNSADRVRENCGASGWRLSDDQMQLLDQGVSL